MPKRRVWGPFLRSRPQPDRVPDLRLKLASGPAAAAVAADKTPRRFNTPEDVPQKVVPTEEIPEAAEDEQVALVDLEEEETITPDEDDTVFEEEEDGDVSNIIDGPLDADEKP